MSSAHLAYVFVKVYYVRDGLKWNGHITHFSLEVIDILNVDRINVRMRGWRGERNVSNSREQMDCQDLL